jgi:hypothetical protein
LRTIARKSRQLRQWSQTSGGFKTRNVISAADSAVYCRCIFGCGAGGIGFAPLGHSIVKQCRPSCTVHHLYR